jgi:hypothetical protein
MHNRRFSASKSADDLPLMHHHRKSHNQTADRKGNFQQMHNIVLHIALVSSTKTVHSHPIPVQKARLQAAFSSAPRRAVLPTPIVPR